MRGRRRKDSGFALLLVFLMGAILAISLYMEIPRVAFESQRQKEQLLVERGEQYKRAIQLFMKANQRWPSRIEDLENTNNRRYLRKRYVDPMTGKDEWRVIHIQNGMLVDSKVQKPQEKKDTGPTSSYIGETAGLGQQMQNTGQSARNPGLQRRGSDNLGPGGVPVGGNPNDPNAPGMPPGMPGMQPGGIPGGNMAGISGQPSMPPVQPGMNGQPGSGIPQQPGGFPQQPGGFPQQPGGLPQGGLPQGGLPPGGLQPGGFPGQQPGGLPGQPQGIFRGGMPPGVPGGPTGPPSNNSGSSYLGSGSSYLGGGSPVGSQPSNPGMSGQQGMPGQPVYPPGNPVNSQIGGMSPTYGTTPGSNGTPPGFQQPGMTINPQAQNAAAQMIGQILTQPRPGGMPQTNTNGVGAMGSGIAGFASTADQESIMVYNDQQNYGTWEFIFDPAKQKPLANPNGGGIGTPASQMGQQIGTPANQVGTPAGPSPFGASPFGGQQQQPGRGMVPGR